MSEYLYVLVFSLVGGLFSLVGGILLLSRESWSQKLAKYATPFAAGGLLAAVFLDLLKDGIEQAQPEKVLYGTLAGIVIFFLMERFLHWFHHHHEEDVAEKKVSKNLIILGDTVHNALDGVAIAAAFLISVPTGIITSLAVAAHEIPQEIGDLGLLLDKGMAKKDVLIVNVMSALAATATAMGTFLLGSQEKLPLELLLGLSAGFLLYIAMSDIIPTIHQHSNKKKLFDTSAALLIAGVVIVGSAIHFAHKYIEPTMQSNNPESICSTSLLRVTDNSECVE